ncbi:MAG TPA: beta-1,6-N-acetylglucosaminyltransferase [Sediminibacterium sp.]|nr:beta-1,6-N-acetylglucosaminyltransferase [Sediminibacterium sp.]
MKLAHLIMAHNQPPVAELGRLVRRLRHPDAVVYIHYDLKFDIAPVKAFFAEYPEVFFIRNRVNVGWATYSMIEATVNSFREILQAYPGLDYLNLLSGQDYPIRPVKTLHDFLEQHPGKAFMHTLDVYTEWTEAISRVTKYHLNGLNIPGKYFIQGWMNRILPRRKMPGNMVPVGRSQWFTIAGKHVRYIVEELERNKALVRFFKLSWAPDEMLFQTILYNSDYRKDMVNDNLRYIDWSEGNKNPKLLTIEDLEPMLRSGRYFARKFSAAKDATVLDLLDQQQ